MKIVVAICFFMMALPLSAKDGKDIFLEHKCNKCHGIKSQGIKPEKEGKGNDLSEIGKKLDSDTIQKFLKKEIKLKNSKGKMKKHIKKFKGSDEDLKTLADWLETLKG